MRVRVHVRVYLKRKITKKNMIMGHRPCPVGSSTKSCRRTSSGQQHKSLPKKLLRWGLPPYPSGAMHARWSPGPVTSALDPCSLSTSLCISLYPPLAPLLSPSLTLSLSLPLPVRGYGVPCFYHVTRSLSLARSRALARSLALSLARSYAHARALVRLLERQCE